MHWNGWAQLPRAGAADRRVAAVVAEGVTSRSAADKDWMPEEYGIAGRMQVGLDRLTYALVDAFTAALRAVADRQ